MYNSKSQNLSNSFNTIEDNFRDISFTIADIEEAADELRVMIDDALSQLKEIIGDYQDSEDVSITVKVEDLLSLHQILDDIETELSEL